MGTLPQEDTAEPDFALEIWSEGRSARLNSSLNLLEKIAKNGHRKASCHRLSWRNLKVPHVEHLAQTQYAQSWPPALSGLETCGCRQHFVLPSSTFPKPTTSPTHACLEQCNWNVSLSLALQQQAGHQTTSH